MKKVELVDHFKLYGNISTDKYFPVQELLRVETQVEKPVEDATGEPVMMIFTKLR